MSRAATKTATIYTRVDPKIKRESEKVLNKLGISMSSAVGMFLHQIVIKQAIPIDLSVHQDLPHSINGNKMTFDDSTNKIKKSFEDTKNGDVYSLS